MKIPNNFVQIPGYPEYLISTEGYVYSTKVDRYLNATLNSSGYYIICFTYNNIRKNFLLHRLLAFVFLDLPSLSSELEVDHNDGNKTNNNLNNLIVRSKEEHNSKTLKTLGYTERNTSDDYCACGNTKERRAKVCITCFNTNRPKKNEDITQEQIEYWVGKFSWVRAAKELGLTDNGLRRRYKILSGKDPKQIPKYNK